MRGGLVGAMLQVSPVKRILCEQVHRVRAGKEKGLLSAGDISHSNKLFL